MRDVLQDDFLKLIVTDYNLAENLAEGRCHIECNVVEQPGDRRLPISGDGVGLVDAFFAGLCSRYHAEHPSLKSIRFNSFSVRGLISESDNGQASDAMAEVGLGVANSYGSEFLFAARSRSVTQSTIEAVVGAVEYFVNSERAYVKMYAALQHYKSVGRTDLVAKYTDLLAQMVRNTSYSEVIEKLKREA